DLAADGHRHLLANDLRFIDGARDVLDHRPGATDLPFAPGPGALHQAAVDADQLARDVVALDRRLVHGAADLLRGGPGHADRLAHLATGRLGDGLVAGAADSLVRRRLHGAADRVTAFLQDGLAHRAADRVGARPQLGPLHRDPHGVAAFLQDGLAHRAAD